MRSLIGNGVREKILINNICFYPTKILYNKSNISVEELYNSVEKVFNQDEYKDKNLKLVSIGAERIVFKVEGVPNRVFKIGRNALSHRLQLGMPDDQGVSKANDRETIKRQIAEWEDEKELEKEAIEIFGEEHFLKRGIFRVTVPVTRELMSACFPYETVRKEIYDKYPEESIGSFKMLAESQEELEVLTNPDDYFILSIGIRILNKQELFKDAESLNEVLERIRVKIDQQISVMKDFIRDKYCSPALKDLFEKIVKYTKKTGRMVDLLGMDNIVLYAGGAKTIGNREHVKGWNYKIIEFSMSGPKDAWITTLDEDKDRNYSCLCQYYAYFYLVSTVAKMLKIQDDLVPSDLCYFKKPESSKVEE